MGKYGNNTYKESRNDLLQKIANELAESNRLKRLELDLSISLHRDELKESSELFHYREELEDKV